jgi:hypothetical protein
MSGRTLPPGRAIFDDQEVNMSNRVVVAAACVLLAAGCGQDPSRPGSAAGIAAPSSVALKAVDVPFSATMTGGIRYIPPPPSCAGLATAAHATGTARHLGEVAFDAQQCMNPATGAGQGSFVITAANGDELRGTMVLQSSAPSGVGSQIHLIGTYTFAGGTGRFDDATGSAAVTGVVTQAASFPWPGDWEWSGAIRY